MTDAVIFGFGCLATYVCRGYRVPHASSLPRRQTPEETTEKVCTGKRHRRLRPVGEWCHRQVAPHASFCQRAVRVIGYDSDPRLQPSGATNLESSAGQTCGYTSRCHPHPLSMAITVCWPGKKVRCSLAAPRHPEGESYARA